MAPTKKYTFVMNIHFRPIFKLMTPAIFSTSINDKKQRLKYSSRSRNHENGENCTTKKKFSFRFNIFQPHCTCRISFFLYFRTYSTSFWANQQRQKKKKNFQKFLSEKKLKEERCVFTIILLQRRWPIFLFSKNRTIQSLQTLIA